MIYSKKLDAEWQLLNDAQLRAKIIAAVLAHWSEYAFPWTLHVVQD
jgi:hypothetical protein